MKFSETTQDAGNRANGSNRFLNFFSLFLSLRPFTLDVKQIEELMTRVYQGLGGGTLSISSASCM